MKKTVRMGLANSHDLSSASSCSIIRALARPSFASLLIGQGESLAYIRDQLGHHSIQITVDTYGHLVPGGNRQAVDRLADTQPRPAAQAAACG